VVEAIMAGTAMPSRNTPPDEQYALKPIEEGYYMNRLNNREVSNSQLVSGTLKYPGDVGHGGTINALVSSEIAEPMFNQTEGCGQ
jgi:hypothetical protein